MRKYILIFTIFVVSLGLLGGCAKDGADGPQGPTGPPGEPQKLKVLILGSLYSSGLKWLTTAMYGDEYFPMGTEINYINAQDSVPPLSVLREYNAILLFTGVSLSYPDSLGDRAADYVDAGGGLVICQACFTTTWRLEGRIMSTGYSPFTVEESAAASSVRTINPVSLDMPLHPIFNGTDINNLVYWANQQLSYPQLTSGATLLGENSAGFPAVAISANKKIIALDVYPYLNLGTSNYDETSKLLANALKYVSGVF